MKNAIERMNKIINEMTKLRNEFESIVEQLNDNEKELLSNLTNDLLTNDEYEDLDSFENLTEEELEGLINYDEEEEEEIFKVHFNEEDFALLFEITEDIPYGYVHDTINNSYIITIDRETLYDIDEALDRQRNYEKYENGCSYQADRIKHLQNELYLQVKAQELY